MLNAPTVAPQTVPSAQASRVEESAVNDVADAPVPSAAVFEPATAATPPVTPTITEIPGPTPANSPCGSEDTVTIIILPTYVVHRYNMVWLADRSIRSPWDDDEQLTSTNIGAWRRPGLRRARPRSRRGLP